MSSPPPPLDPPDPSPQQRALVRAALLRGLADDGVFGRDGRVKARAKSDIARATGCSKGTITKLVAEADEAQPPKLDHLLWLADEIHQSLEEMIADDASHFMRTRRGVRWRLAGRPRSARLVAARRAASLLLEGVPRSTIVDRVRAIHHARGEALLDLTENRLHGLIRTGVHGRLIEFEHDGDATQLLSAELGRDLEAALDRDSPGEQGREVYVVKNLAHKDFHSDPLAPALVGHVARWRLARHLRVHRTVYRLGLAGGIHCEELARGCDDASSPFPLDSGDKQLTFVPLTLEPFPDQRLPIATAVVSELARQAATLLGAERVKALSLQASGFLSRGRLEPLERSTVAAVRDQFAELDVAVYGCGDRCHAGWLERTLMDLELGSDREPCTDLCLNLLDEHGELVPLADGRALPGINLQGLRRLVNPDKLSMLLTSGPHKGLPLVAAARARCANAIVCDERAAQAALEVLGRGD